VIVGFPGETDEHFDAMLELLEEIQFDRVGAFAYSLEEGTRAAELDGQVPPEVASERLEELMELQRAISFEKNQALVGTTTTALVDERVDGDAELVAAVRTRAQALDIDGVTHLCAPAQVDPGAFVEVDIVDALDYDLVAELRGAPGSATRAH
jgi:ribosomal protein S12 methylthiotransferase